MSLVRQAVEQLRDVQARLTITQAAIGMFLTGADVADRAPPPPPPAEARMAMHEARARLAEASAKLHRIVETHAPHALG